MSRELIDKIARDLGVTFEARKKWRQRKCVPHRWRLPIIRAAEKCGVTLDEQVFDWTAEPAAGAPRSPRSGSSPG